jgi:penicillin-binding protein 1C
VTALAALLTVLAGWLALPLVPLPPALFTPPPAQQEFVDRNGIPLRAVRAEEAPFTRPAALGEIPEALVHATLAAEDKRFWRHPGVDWRASLRASWDLARHRRIVSGGSTLTQQLVKLAQPRPRTFRTKLIEAAQALRLEQIWDKQRILTEYLNRIDYGNLNTGCAAAADFYFGKPLRDLSVAECALLAGLPQSPARLNPLTHPERARKRQQWILRQMRVDGFLTAEELERAFAESLRFKSPHRAYEAPHFIDLLLAGTPHSALRTSLFPLPTSLSAFPAPPSPAPIRTTLDLDLNRFAEEAVRRQVALLGEQHVGDAAVVVIDNLSGDVLALVGSEDYFSPAGGQVNGAWAPRSAGSTFKPFTYLIAFEQGATPASIVADVPTEFATATGLFAPVNYDRHCRGPVRYRPALANSLNIAAVKVLASIGGPAALQKRLQACGLTTLTDTPEHYGLGLTIGNAEARLLELANAYASLARLGEYKPCEMLRRSRPNPSSRLFDPAACFLVADILSDNDARALEFGVESNLRFDFPVACKTGTSSDFRDNWAFGYTPEFTVGVWAGNFDGSPMQGISGVTGAAPIMHELMEHLHRRYGTSWYATPTNIVSLPVHFATGKRLRDGIVVSAAAGSSRLPPGSGNTRNRPDRIVEKFIVGRLPAEESPQDYDAQGRIRLGAEYRDWLGTSDNWLAGQAVADETSSPFRIVFPLPGTVIYLDPDLPDGGRRIHLQVEGSSQPQWRSDTVECRTEAGQTFALLAAGEHHLKAVDPRTGLEIETCIQVLRR